MAANDDFKQIAAKDAGRMDRQLIALGADMVIRMKKAKVLLSGLGGLGVEIAKNVALAGVKGLTLHDTVATTHLDLATQFYLGEKDIGKNRAEISIKSIEELNPFCPITLNTDDIFAGDLSFLKDYACVILTEQSIDTQKKVNDFCHENNIPFMSADVRGVFCSAFADFGAKFTIHDKDGEQPHDVLISNISQEEKATITCLQFHRCPFSEGDFVTFKEIKGMEALNSGNYKVTCVKYDRDTKTGSFQIDFDTSKFDAFQPGSGRATEDKVDIIKEYTSLSDLLSKPNHEKFVLSDFAKFGRPQQLHLAFLALDKFAQDNKGNLPKPWDSKDADQLVAIAKKINNDLVDDLNEDVIRAVSHTAQGSLCPLTGFLGGFISQEVLKAVSGKFTPLNQFFYLDAMEILPESSDVKYTPSKKRDEAQIICLGDATNKILRNARLFTVGSGAIGCELLKNYAMMGIATEGKGEVVITDDDHIELSNLNRQFLFREKDINKPKSVSAVAAVKQMNPSVNIVAYEKRVHTASEDTFSNTFFQSMNCIVNALDNINARLYVDQRCVDNQKPLIEPGTLSSKGHVQVIVPFLTENYGNQRDPEQQDIPFCTIKSFPHNTQHCIQWARDLCFEKKFAADAQRWNKFFSLDDPIGSLSSSNASEHRPDIIHRLAKQAPKNFDDCVKLARVKWEKYYVHAPSDLLNAFPLDHKNDDGKAFWSSPKRPPHPLKWDSKNPENLLFVSSYANLLAFVWGIEQSHDQANIAKVADATDIPAWKPRKKKIETDESKKAPSDDDTKSDKLDPESIKSYSAFLSNYLKDASTKKKLNIVDFEKDDDTNFHIDCIHATSSLRARVYSIDEVKRMETKRIAGRILPALATTTSCVSGWAMIQLITVLQGHKKIEQYKSAFLNLALPTFNFCEPGASKKTKISDDVTFDHIWSQWIMNKPDATVQEVLDFVENEYSFVPDSIFQDGRTIFLGFLHTDRLDKKLLSLDNIEIADDDKFILLTLTPEEESSDDDDDIDDDDDDENIEGALLKFALPQKK